MTSLALDMSSKTGWAFKDGLGTPEYGVLEKQDITDQTDMVEIICIAKRIAHQIDLLVKAKDPSIIIIERPVKGRLAQTQTFLNFIHYAVLDNILNSVKEYHVKYVWPAQWRSLLGLKLSKDQRKNNAKLYKAKKLGVDKKTVGVKGRVGQKHLSVAYVNEKYNLKLKMKDNDIADAICLSIAGELI